MRSNYILFVFLSSENGKLVARLVYSAFKQLSPSAFRETSGITSENKSNIKDERRRGVNI